MPHTLFLVVEDSEDDVLLLQRLFRNARILNPVKAVGSAEEAVAYFEGTGPYRNHSEFPLPALVFLDLRLPGMSGFEFLEWLRQQPNFSGTPVVVLSSLAAADDRDRAHALGANSFLAKPAALDKILEISQMLDGSWCWLDSSPSSNSCSSPLFLPSSLHLKADWPTSRTSPLPPFSNN